MCLAVLATSAPAAVIRVKWDSPADGPGNNWDHAYRTVTAAMAASVSGGEIWVAGDSAHPYFERITLKTRVRLYGGFAGTEISRAQRNVSANTTILDGSGAGDVVKCPEYATAETVVDGLTIRNAGANHYGMFCKNTALTIANNTITGNGYGVYCWDRTCAGLTANTILGNGTGIQCWSDSHPSITNNSISGNGIGISCGFSTPEHPTITNNAFTGNDIGIECTSLSYPSITNNTFGANSTGVQCSSSSHPLIANNTFTGQTSYAIACFSSGTPVIASNLIVSNGPCGVLCSGSSPAVTNNTIASNGTGVECAFSASPTIKNNIVAFNFSGIAAYSLTGTPTLNSNCVYNPEGTNYDGLVPGPGSVSVDPLFVARETGDYHLQLLSPCINAGVNWAVTASDVDMDGEARVLPAEGVVDLGADEYGVHPVYSLAEAKTSVADGQEVYLAGRWGWRMIATAKLDSQQAFYMERPDRAGGIRCSGAALLEPGQAGLLHGIMATTVFGERVLTQASVFSGTQGTADVPKPVSMTSRSVGGVPNGLQPGALWGKGLNNIGLLVKVFGSVTFVDPGGQFFTITDGSAWNVAAPPLDPNGNPGVQVWAPGLVPAGLGVGDFVTVTGISSCTKVGENLFPQVLVRTASDIVTQAF